MSRNKAKTTILKWYDKRRSTQAERVHFSRNIDLFFETIAEREHWNESRSTLLGDGATPRFAISGRAWRADPTARGLAVTSLVPGWGFGWKDVFKEEISEHFFSWLGHYCIQYIHRSNICKVLMAAWEKDGIILHPFGVGSIARRYAGSTSEGSPKHMLAISTSDVIHQWGRVINRPAVS